MPGVAAVLDALDAAGVATCVASSGLHQRIRMTLTRVGLIDRFGDRLFSAEDVGIGKPAPDLFLHAAATVGVEPVRCAVVEDAPAGIQAAAAAGMVSFGYTGLTPASLPVGGHRRHLLAHGSPERTAPRPLGSPTMLAAKILAVIAGIARGGVGAVVGHPHGGGATRRVGVAQPQGLHRGARAVRVRRSPHALVRGLRPDHGPVRADLADRAAGRVGPHHPGGVRADVLGVRRDAPGARPSSPAARPSRPSGSPDRAGSAPTSCASPRPPSGCSSSPCSSATSRRSTAPSRGGRRR